MTGEARSSNVDKGMFTSTIDNWSTPQALFAALDAEFGFSIDAAASPANAKCGRYFTRHDDGLAQQWDGTVWLNPPYGRGIGAWVRKAWESSQAGATVVCLIPARTDTSYWHDYVMRAAEVRFIAKRIAFDHPDGDGHVTTAHNAPFPSVVVVFRPGHDGRPAMSAMSREGAA